LVKRLNLRPQGKFALVGHSDAPNSDQPNLLLSDQRTTVVEALLTKAGIAEQRILIAPVASHEPLEEMSASTQLNRRVTLQVVDPAVAG
jgi:outer membrane protein OmpA-like peptidoglycan-associated protein